MTKEKLEQLYRKYNRREFVHPDPLEFLYRYNDLRDREVVAFIASSLAYGRVAQILKSVSRVLEQMVPSPWMFVNRTSLDTIKGAFWDFKHRFTAGEELSYMLFGLKRALERHGSLYACFAAGLKDEHDSVLPALASFTTELTVCTRCRMDHLVPFPKKGSACKRLNLFLRWMVRRDEVDPGGWEDVPASKLIVPVDTHMHRIGLLLGLTRRKHADMITAMEITNAFRVMSPEDPVRYDFPLTRLGMQGDADLAGFLKE